MDLRQFANPVLTGFPAQVNALIARVRPRDRKEPGPSIDRTAPKLPLSMTCVPMESRTDGREIMPSKSRFAGILAACLRSLDWRGIGEACSVLAITSTSPCPGAFP
jgi:hypothetical protein